MTALDPGDLDRLAVESRRRQGLPDFVEDPATIARLLPLVQELSSPQNERSRALLYALRPYLKPARQEKIERALQNRRTTGAYAPGAQSSIRLCAVSPAGRQSCATISRDGAWQFEW